jgi:glycerophosphoryl diester phosphodiesterase
MKVIAHRGGSHKDDDNSIKAILAGLKSNADELELDVRVSKLGVPILSHDQPTSADCPTLEDAFKIVSDQIPIILDIKPDQNLKPIVAIIKKTGIKRIKIASFDFNLLLELRSIEPSIDIVLLERWSGIRAIHRAKKLGTQYIGMNQRRLWAGFIRHMALRGIKLIAYTVNSRSQAIHFKKAGIYGLVTDYPNEINLIK